MAVESLSRDLYGDKLKNKKIDELNLEETNDALGALQKYCEDLGGVAREDREELDALQAHIQKLES
ncbi:hypothetical protein IKI14_05125 [bacterium]|nr:hypothetical protein [bacterium]